MWVRGFWHLLHNRDYFAKDFFCEVMGFPLLVIRKKEVRKTFLKIFGQTVYLKLGN